MLGASPISPKWSTGMLSNPQSRGDHRSLFSACVRKIERKKLQPISN